MTVGDVIRRNAELFPARVAFVCGSRQATFGSFDARVNRLANALAAQGLAPGERVALILPSDLELLEAYGACEKIGLVAVPMNTRLHAREVADILIDSEPAALIYDARVAHVIPDRAALAGSIRFTCAVAGEGDTGHTSPAVDYEALLAGGSSVAPDVKPKPDDTAYLYYTSGTTGKPKGVMQTHRSALNNARRVMIDLEIRPDDVTIGSSPLFHIGGRSMCFNYFYRGCTAHLMPKFDPDEFLRIAARESATMLLAVPTTLKMLLDSPERKHADLHAVRSVFYSGAPAAAPVLREVTAWLGNVLQQVYGMSETGPAITILRREDHAAAIASNDDQRLLSCGRPCLDVDVRAVDDAGTDVKPGEVGEVLVSSDSLMAGYWRLPELSAEALRDGWLHTGDLGVWDEEGYLYLVDRKKEMIVSGSENVYPREVENVLYAHPGVAEVAVIGIPDERWGETVLAIVVPKPGAQLSGADIADFCSDRIAGYKKPRRVEFVTELPQNSIGKIDKKKLREKYWSHESRNIR
jgi:acyl-CoA synthetase (AMP-forming)/AMP-acid ligase II